MLNLFVSNKEKNIKKKAEIYKEKLKDSLHQKMHDTFKQLVKEGASLTTEELKNTKHHCIHHVYFDALFE